MVPHVPSPDAVRAVAPGKINLILRVGPRKTNGYHDLLTCFHAVDVWETVTVTPAESYSVTISGDVNIGEVPLGEDNLVVKAAKLVARELGSDKRVAIHIDKQVPVGGGMGGGSADAAATLIAVNELWEGDLSQARLLALAGELGADVPFLLEGYSQIGRSHGGDLEPLRSQPLWWVVIPSVENLSTPRVYDTLDQLRGDGPIELPPDVPVSFRMALFDGDARAVSEFLVNDLEAAACSLVPSLVSTLALGRELGALAAMVSGSGPTCVLLAENQGHAKELATLMTERGYHASVVSSPGRGAHRVSLR